MSEPTKSLSPDGELFAPRAAVKLGMALLALFAAVVLLAAAQKERRSTLESFSETTAVGDLSFFNPDAHAAPEAALRFKGHPIAIPALKHLTFHDSRMRSVGTDEGGAYRIYVNADEKENSGRHYVKTGAEQYVEVQL